VTVRLATGPVSWGVDFAGAPDNPPWRSVLDGAAAAGFRWLELGPLGYLPPNAGEALARRGIGVTAGFVFEPLHEPDALGATLATGHRTAAAVKAAGGRFLVLIDSVSPERSRTAGRPDLAPRLGRRRRAALARAVARLSVIAGEHGLHPVFHPHAGSYVEFPDEIDAVLELADLCLDTGHCAYAGVDPVELYRSRPERIPYLHLKDLDPDRRGEDFWASVHNGAFRPLGAGVVDFAGLLGALAARGFDGWAVVEQDRAPGAGDVVADLAASRAFLEALAERAPAA
jgi:inosose dehydratase